LAPSRSVELRVGVFFLVCLLIVAGLIVKFGQIGKFSAPAYEITVVFPNVAGLIREANVLYAGIPVGKVRDIRLAEDGHLKVRVTLAINEGIGIRRDARFIINQSGLLGDRYVDVIPVGVTEPFLRAGDEVIGTASVDLTEAIRSVVAVLHQAAGTIGRIDEAVRRTDAALARIDQLVLTTQTLAHVTATLANIAQTTSNTAQFTAGLEGLVAETRGPLTNTLAHLDAAAGNANQAAANVNLLTKRLDDLVFSRQDDITVLATNLAASAERLNDILTKLQQGQGTAGKLLVDPVLHDEIVKLVENWRRYGILSKEGPPRPLPGDTPRGGRTPVPARPAKP
jgi:phospholipid/cholesterol/gamma-HCH transport system substrate-binding protein